MNNHASLPPESARFKCHDCQYKGPSPIVKPVANPIDSAHGRCSNRKACERRQLRIRNAQKAKS